MENEVIVVLPENEVNIFTILSLKLSKHSNLASVTANCMTLGKLLILSLP
jgi:hypothetical protein